MQSYDASTYGDRIAEVYDELYDEVFESLARRRSPHHRGGARL